MLIMTKKLVVLPVMQPFQLFFSYKRVYGFINSNPEANGAVDDTSRSDDDYP